MRRYNLYKDSEVEWIGEIPSHWECIRLGMLGNFSSSGIDKKLNDDEYPVRMVNFTDLIQSRNYFPVQTGEKEYMKVTTPYSKFIEHKLNKGDMVFIPSSETHEDLGYSSLIDFEEDDVVYSYHILRFRTNREIYHYFKKYLINHHSVLNQFSSEGKGTTRQIIGRNVFNNVKVVLPPLSEQQQIVSYLDTKTSQIDSLIEKTKRKIELLKEKRTSLINEVVTKGLNPNVEMKESGVEWIGEIPSHWEKKKIKHITKIFGRIGFRGYTTEDIVDEGNGVITISPSNIKNDVFSTENSTYITWEKYYESPEIQIFPNDIIIVKTGSTIGKTSIIPFETPEMTLNPQLIVLKDIQMNPKFLYYQTVCKFIKESFDIEQTGSTTPTISQEKVNGFPVLNPPTSEQEEIVSYLDKHTQLIDKTISIEEKRIELLKEYRQSLISEVVTGKRKVTND
jgi:type I restriction enzyme, S subunit